MERQNQEGHGTNRKNFCIIVGKKVRVKKEREGKVEGEGIEERRIGEGIEEERIGEGEEEKGKGNKTKYKPWEV